MRYIVGIRHQASGIRHQASGNGEREKERMGENFAANYIYNIEKEKE